MSGNSDHARRRLCSWRAKAKAAPRTVGFVPEIVDPLRWFDSQAAPTWLLSQRQRQVVGKQPLGAARYREGRIRFSSRQHDSHSVGVGLIGEYLTLILSLDLYLFGSGQRCRSNLFAKYCSAPMGSHSNIRDGVKNLRWQFAHEAIAGTLPLCFKIAKRRSVEPHE